MVGYHTGIYALWNDPTPSDARIAWVRGTWAALGPLSAGGVYVNELGEDEGGDRVQVAYGPNYDRLRRVKAQYGVGADGALCGGPDRGLTRALPLP